MAVQLNNVKISSSDSSVPKGHLSVKLIDIFLPIRLRHLKNLHGYLTTLYIHSLMSEGLPIIDIYLVTYKLKSLIESLIN